MKSPTLSITNIGDCCVDIYPEQKKVFLGGTAFNVSYNAKRAGFNASIVSVVGTDSYGDLFLEKAQKLGINTTYLQQISGSTSNVQIPLDAEGKPMFAGWDIGVLDHLKLTSEHKSFFQTQDVVRATLLKPLQMSFEQFCSMSLPNTFKVGDLAGGSIYSIKNEEIEKYMPGLDMIVRSVDTLQCNVSTDVEHLRFLARKYNKIILASLGSEGSLILTKDEEYFEPAIPVSVTDTTGAGDAYIAYFLYSYLSSKNIQKSMKLATKEASKVVTQFGSNIE